MQFFFNERKTAQMAALFLDLHGGRMYYIQLIKLMYLADRLSLLEKGRTISGDSYVSMKYGPVLSRTFKLIRDDMEDKTGPWHDCITAPSDHQVSLKQSKPLDFDQLSKYETRIISQLHEKYGSIDRFDLARMTHTLCPEWKDPGESSVPIRLEDILRGDGLAEHEIEEWKQEAQAVETLELVQEAIDTVRSA
jgi:uncharacterized phage-associated protein